MHQQANIWQLFPPSNPFHDIFLVRCTTRVRKKTNTRQALGPNSKASVTFIFIAFGLYFNIARQCSYIRIFCLKFITPPTSVVSNHQHHSHESLVSWKHKDQYRLQQTALWELYESCYLLGRKTEQSSFINVLLILKQLSPKTAIVSNMLLITNEILMGFPFKMFFFFEAVS